MTSKIYHEEIVKSSIEYELQAYFKEEIKSVEALGFGNLCFSRSIWPSYSVLTSFYLYPLLKILKAWYKIEKPLRYVLFNPVLMHYDFDTYCEVDKMGVCYMTHFTDNAMLMTLTYDAVSIENDKLGIYKYRLEGRNISAKAAWNAHKERMYQMEMAGREVNRELSYERFAEMMERNYGAMGM